MGVEAGAAGQVEDAGVLDEGGDCCADVFALDQGNGFLAEDVVGRLDCVVLG